MPTFEDTWTLDKEDVAWMGLIADQHPAIHSVAAAGDAHSTGMQSYLRMMAVRPGVHPRADRYGKHRTCTATRRHGRAVDAARAWFRMITLARGQQTTTAQARHRPDMRRSGRSRCREWTCGPGLTPYGSLHRSILPAPGTSDRTKLGDLTGPGWQRRGTPTTKSA